MVKITPDCRLFSIKDKELVVKKMFFPILKGNSGKKSEISAFGGLNLTESFVLGEFSDMENITSDKFPSLCPSVKKDKLLINSEIKNIQGFAYHGDDEIEVSGFTGVADGKYYYQDKHIPFAYDFMKIPVDSKVDLLNYGDKIIIMPMMYVHEYKKNIKGQDVYPLFSGSFDDFLTISTNSGDDGTISISFETNSEESWLEMGFTEGDSVVIECDEEGYSRLNVYIKKDKYETGLDYRTIVEAIVKEVSSKKLTLYMYNDSGTLRGVTDDKGNDFTYEFKRTVRVYKRYPEFENACIYANRMWLTAKDGEKIYASVPGNFKEFAKFEGLSTDSWYTEVGDEGRFTGITSFKDGVLAFKENRIYHILGDRPVNFNIAKRFFNCGAIDAKTICLTDTAVYFMGSDGIYEYSGGNPVNISKTLGIKKYLSGSAFSDGKKYYFSCNGDGKIYAYDRSARLWHVEALFDLCNGVKIKSEIYLASKDSVFKLSDIYENEWSAILCDITEKSMEHKGINDIFIRIKNSDNSYARVSVSLNDGEFSECGFTDTPGEFTFRVPVRFKKGDKYNIKISGKGNSVIKGIERSFYVGGGAFTRKG